MTSLDNFARRLLRLLQQDARQTVQQLAEAVGLSATPCWRRIKQMEDGGVIRGYVALIERERVGLNFCALAHVSLARHTEGGVEAFERTVKQFPEVIECFEITGDADYLLKIVVTDVKAYDEFLHQKMFPIPGLANVRTSIVLREVKDTAALPI